MRTSVAVCVFAVAAAFCGPAPAQADAAGPAQVSASFDRWYSQQDQISVSWSAVAGSDGYDVFYEKNGFHYPLVHVDSGTTSYTFTRDLTAGPIIVGVTSRGALGSGTTTTTLDVPGPQLFANPVNGGLGQADVMVTPAFSGDTLSVQMGPYGSGPASWTTVPLDTNDEAHLTGLATNTTYELTVSESRPDAADDTAPVFSTTMHTVPPAERNLQVNDRQDEGKPNSFFVVWDVPAGCDSSRPFMNCDLAWVILKPGTAPSGDPSDGQNVCGCPSGSMTNQSAAVLDDIQIGATYTVTVFRTADQVHWSPPVSRTFTNKVKPHGSLTASPAQAQEIGQPVTLTGTISSPYVTPTGTVSFETNGANGANTLCAPQELPANGVVTCQTTTTEILRNSQQEGVGTRLIFLNYSGDQNVEGNRGWWLTYDVTKALPTVAASPPSQPTVTRMVTIHARVRGAAGTPTGTVKMTAGNLVLCRSAHLRDGRTRCAVAGDRLGAGRHTVLVTYRGDAYYRRQQTKVTFRVKR